MIRLHLKHEGTHGRKVIPREEVVMKIRVVVDARGESTTITGKLWLWLRLSGVLFDFNIIAHYVFDEKLECLCIRPCLEACVYLFYPPFVFFLFIYEILVYIVLQILMPFIIFLFVEGFFRDRGSNMKTKIWSLKKFCLFTCPTPWVTFVLIVAS